MKDEQNGIIQSETGNILDIGATPLPDGSTRFRVWGERAQKIEVSFPGSGRVPVALAPEENGYFSGTVSGIGDGDRYYYLLDDTLERPDPASRFQPEGVHGPSQVVDQGLYRWNDIEWLGIEIEKYLIYELHVGLFTPQGTFDGIIPRLDYLCDLGITAVELMPVAQFAGERNWGYDGVFPFAPQNSYGGPDGLKRLVDACHARGLAVILDVIYSHLGAEGNCLHAFGPYFTNRYQTPWGDAVNFDGAGSDPVRHYFVSNAMQWINEYHIDALRLDAIHAMYDSSALHILQELSEAVHREGAGLGRHVHAIADSNLNDVRLITPQETGGFGLDAQWNEDFHHSLWTLLTGDRRGKYADFGSISALVKSFQEGFVFTGGYSPVRDRKHGSSSVDIPTSKLVVFSQNHDQIGSRMGGERPGTYLSTQQLMLAAATVLLSPYPPLLFMGEEYGETAPFPRFVSHGDPDPAGDVRHGDPEELAALEQKSLPDPRAEATFLSAKLNQEQRHSGRHRAIFEFYRDLIRLRKESPSIFRTSRDNLQLVAREEEQVMVITRSYGNVRVLCLFNYSDKKRVIDPSLASGTLMVLLDSTGNSPPRSTVTVYTTRPATFVTLPPFGVIVYKKE